MCLPSILHSQTGCCKSQCVTCQVRERTKQAPGKPEQREWDFAAQANAMVVKDAESYYRNMYFKGLACLK